MFQAAETSSTLDLSDVQLRNSALDNRLRECQLQSRDVIGDWNCFFRAISVCICGLENQHADLRKSIAQHMIDLATRGHNLFFGGEVSVVQNRAKHISQQGVWPGEDILPIAASYLQRDLHIFLANFTTWPLIYSADIQQTLPLSPITLAFYEPGHYKAVIPRSGIINQHLSLSVTSDVPTAAPPSYSSLYNGLATSLSSPGTPLSVPSEPAASSLSSSN